MSNPVEIQSDKWSTMSSAELSGQMEAIHARIASIHACGAASNPAYSGLLSALQQASQDLTDLLSK